MTVWQNWARCVTAEPSAVVTPRDENELSAVILAAAERGQQVRAVGAGHSFTPIAATDGVQLRLDRLSGLVGADTATGLATLRAGTRLHDIPALLEPYGLAMANLGDIDTQTLAGAISTGTHGTGAAFPGLSGQVRGLRLVVADGSVVSCSADEHPDLFAAARLGLGAFGVLVEITLQCVPRFLLAADEHPEPLAQVLETFVERSGSVDHLEFYWFPHTDRALVKADQRWSVGAERSEIPYWKSFIDDELMSNGLFELTCRLGTAVPALVPGVNRLATRLVSDRRYTDDSARVFSSPRRVRFREMEYAIEPAALAAVITELDLVIRQKQWRISFPIEVRIAAADDIPLSTSFHRPSVYVAVHRFWREPHASYFLAAERIFLDHGGRPHWGKLHSLDADRLRPRYPRFDAVVATRQRVDPHHVFGNAYLERVLTLSDHQSGE